MNNIRFYNKQKGSNLIYVILLTLYWWPKLTGCDFIRLPGGPGVRMLKQTLELFVQTNMARSGINIDQLYQAAGELVDWPPNDQTNLISLDNTNSPTDQLMIDVVLFPLKNLQLQTGYGMGGSFQASPEVLDLYVIRLESTYKSLWPAYHGRLLNDGSVYMCTKFRDLMQALLERRTPNLALLHEAQVDSDLFNEKIEEIVKYDDIYANFDDFLQLCNTYNSPLVNLLRNEIIPSGLAKRPHEMGRLVGEFLGGLQRLGYHVSPTGQLMQVIQVQPIQAFW